MILKNGIIHWYYVGVLDVGVIYVRGKWAIITLKVDPNPVDFCSFTLAVSALNVAHYMSWRGAVVYPADN